MNEPLCQFDYIDDKYVCKICGRVVSAPKDSNVVAYCKKVEKKPSLIRNVINYATAVATHAATGFQKRPDDEVNIILQICQACPNYSENGSYCTKCGCRCNANKSALTNKIRMRSQSCPVGRW